MKKLSKFLLVCSIFFVSLVAAREKEIVVVDFGSQTAHLIVRKLQRLGIKAEIVAPAHAIEAATDAAGVILSGGPSSVYAKGAPTVDPKIFEIDVPVMGICYGWQLMAQMLGGTVESAQKEYGIEKIAFGENTFGLPVSTCSVVVSHGDSVTRLPEGFRVIGSTERLKGAAAVNFEKRWVGLQFHPEVEHTEFGSEMLKYFAVDLCHVEAHTELLDLNRLIQKIRDDVGPSDEVVCAVSGGVDSTMAAFMIAKAIGRRMHAVYVDSDLMRAGTKERVEEIFNGYVDADLRIVDARERFMKALAGVDDPEKKRKIIGELYVDIFQEVAKTLPQVTFLAQGTIYSDVIESKGSQLSDKIKSHHNVGGLPESLRLKLLEPLRPYYKDEVRDLGRRAGLPKEFVDLHPFPGPGYAIRIRGVVTEPRLAQLRQADTIVMEEIRKAGLYDQVFQSFAIMTGTYSTAVKGDGRTFEEVVAIRAYASTDVMTASWARLPYTVLAKISQRIVNEVPRVSRVVYDITNKPPATMEWE